MVYSFILVSLILNKDLNATILSRFKKGMREIFLTIKCKRKVRLERDRDPETTGMTWTAPIICIIFFSFAGFSESVFHLRLHIYPFFSVKHMLWLSSTIMHSYRKRILNGLKSDYWKDKLDSENLEKSLDTCSTAESTDFFYKINRKKSTKTRIKLFCCCCWNRNSYIKFSKCLSFLWVCKIK